MLLDAQLNFVPPGSPLSLVGGAGVAFPSNVIDLLGLGVGVAPTERIIGVPSTGVFGEDAGIGGVKPQVECAIGTALVAVGGSTLNCQFQGAIDTGSAGGYLPGAWQTFMETGAMTAAQLIASAVFGRFDFPPAFPVDFRPRFLRLNFAPSAGGSFSAGTVAFAIVTMVRDDWAEKQAARNYSVAAVS